MKISLSSFAYSVEAHEKVIFSSTVPTSLISMNVHECSVHRGHTGKRIHVPAVPQAQRGGLLGRSAQPAARGYGAGLGQREPTGGCGKEGAVRKRKEG